MAGQVEQRKIERPERPKRELRVQPATRRELPEDFDCESWYEAKKSTLAFIRLVAKENGESKELTKAKLDAVRKQEPEDGNIAIFTYMEGKEKVWDGVVIKKRLKGREKRYTKK